MELSHSQHSAMLKSALAVKPPSSWDSRAQGWVGPIANQEQCGSCWDFSGTGIVEIAYNKAGIGGGKDSFILSKEYTLSCCKNGGCNGDDNVTVLKWAKAHGLPLAKDYGPYGPFPNQDAEVPACAWKPTMKMYKIADWGFADPKSDKNKPTSTPAIKSAIMNYGAVGAAVMADDAFEKAKAGHVFMNTSSEEVNHDIVLVGWDDAKGRNGAWLLRNSWSDKWADNGYCWIEYGANHVGTEAVWCSV